MQHKTEEESYIFCIKIPTTGNIKRGGPDSRKYKTQSSRQQNRKHKVQGHLIIKQSGNNFQESWVLLSETFKTRKETANIILENILWGNIIQGKASWESEGFLLSRKKKDRIMPAEINRM